MNQTEDFNITTSTPLTPGVMPLPISTTDSELDVVGVTFLADESRVENVTHEPIWSLDCAAFVMEYGIIACVVCGIAFVIGVAFCLFGE